MYALILILSLLIWPMTAQAAGTCTDPNSVIVNNFAPSDPETIAYTPPAGTNQILFVGVGQRTGGGVRTHTQTYNGVALTIVPGTTEQYTDPAGAALYYQVNPPAGAHNVVVDWNAAPLADGIIVWTCSDVDTANPFRSAASATGTGTSLGSTPASVQAGDMVIDFVFKDGPEAITIGANQTAIQNGTDTSESAVAASWQLGSDGAAMTETTTASQQWGHISAVLIPLTAPSTRRSVAPIVFE